MTKDYYAIDRAKMSRAKQKIYNEQVNPWLTNCKGTLMLWAALLLLSIAPAIGQTVLISPTGDGGFENGTTFAANGWTAVNGTGNTARVWYAGTGKSGYTGNRAAFIGNSTTTVGTSTASRTVHLYRSITLPPGATNIALSFKYKQEVADVLGSTLYDYIAVYTSTAVPVSGTLPTGTPHFGPFPNVAVPNFANQSVTLPNSLAGTTVNLIFTFKADGVSPDGYGAVDDISLSYVISTSPTISATTLTAFTNTCVNATNATTNSFTLTGANLTGNATVGALAGYTYSTATGGPYTNTLTLTPTSGTINQSVFVRFTPTAVQSYNGDIPISGGGATAINVAAVGAGISTPPSVSNGTLGNVTLNGATISASTISSLGCSAVSAYGIEYSLVSGFTGGTGTQVATSGFSGSAGGTFTTTLTGLTSGTTYYYRAFATNGGGTGYSTSVGSFTTSAPGQIGSGNSTSTTFPILSNFGYNYSQQIYTAAELNATQSAGNTFITKIRFRQATLGSQSTYNNWTIYIGNTAKTNFASTTDWVPLNALSQAFSGVLPVITANSWVEITLATPFIWDGTSNLVIAIDENTPSFSSSSWSSYTAGTGRGIIYYNDTTNPDPASPPTATVTSGDIAQIQIVATPIPNCGTPTAITATATSDTTGTGSFSAPVVGTTPSGYFYELRASGAAGSGATGLIESGTLASTGSFTFTTTLTGNTTYTLYVRSTCGQDIGAFSAGVNFTTACSPVVAFTQNFDASTSIPTCWAKVGTSGTATITTLGNASSPNSLSLLGSSTTGKVVVSLPPVSNAGANTHWLRFKYRFYGTSGETIEVGYLTNPANAASFMPITSVVATSALFTEAQLDLGTAAGTNRYLAFRAGTANTTVFIDDVIWETKPSCFVPAAPLAATPSSVSAVLTFGASPTNPAEYEYYVSTVNTAPTAGTAASGTTNTTTANATGLAPNTLHYWWVRAACGASDKSLWVSGGSFTTMKLEPANQATNFAVNATNVTTTNIPLTWTAAVAGGAAPDGYLLRANNTAVVPTPTDGTDPGSGSLSLATLPASYKATGATAASATFTTGTAGTMYYFNNHTYANSGANINFKTDAPPTLNYATKPAVVSALVTNLPNTSSAEISWTLPATFNAANHTVLVFVKEGSTIATGTLTNSPATYTANAAINAGSPYQADADAHTVYKGTGAGVTITGLTLGQTYFVTVVVVMNTANYNNTHSYSANSDTSILVGYCIPNSTGAKHITNVTITGGASDINKNSTQGANGYQDWTTGSGAVAPASAIQGGTVSFSVATNNTAFLNIWVDWDNNFVFSDSERMYSSTVTTTGPNTGTFVVPVGASLGNHRMRVRNSASINPAACGTINNGEAEDYTFTVLQAPMPTITSFSPASYCAASGLLTIDGTNFLNATVKIGNTAITPISINTAATQITATVNAGISGIITVTTPGGTASSATPFAVTAPPAIVLSSSAATICSGTATPLITITQGASDYTGYSWTSVPAGQPVSGTAAAGFTLSPATNAVYTLTASNPGTTCTTTATFTVTVNASPAAFTVSPAEATICDGQVQAITANGGPAAVTILTEDFNGEVPGWTVINNSIGGIVDNAEWALYESTTSFKSNDNTDFVMSDSNAQGSSGIITETYLISPVFSLANLTSASLEFYHYYSDYDANDSATVQITLDGGVTWTNVQTYTTSQGSATAFVLANLNLTPYINNSNVQLRFKYIADWGYYWAIDNLAVKALSNPQYIWSPATGLYTDAAATIPYTGTSATVVYAKPSVTTSYTASVTNAAGCTTSRTSVITVGPKQWIGGTSTDYNTPSNWCGNTVPTAQDIVRITNTSNKPVVTGNITALAKSVTVEDGGKLTVASGNVLHVTNEVVVGATGEVIFENNAHLIQDAVLNANSGAVKVHRNSSLLFRQDYTMWSSPVAGQNVRSFSQETILARFYTYNPLTDFFESMFANEQSSAGVSFAEGKGYLIRMPNGAPQPGYVEGTTAIKYDGLFTGTPHTGNVTVPVTPGFNAVGNPYPSPISITGFFAANSGNTDGVIYLWRRKNGSTTASAYATVNSEGEFVTSTHAGSDDPNNILQTGQGFVVKAQASSINFNNGMRSSSTVNDNSFFRMNNNPPVVESHRIWLNLSNEASQIAQMLVGYKSNASMGIDTGIDALFINDVETGLNSVIDGNAYVIQGRSLPFDTQDIVPLQFKTPAAGSYSIAIDHVDGMFLGNQDIFLKDNVLGVTHDLKASNYSFTSEAGIFDDRFEIVYAQALGLEGPKVDANTIMIYKQDRNLVVNSGTAVMASVKVFDTRGRLVYERSNINAGETVISDLRAQEQMLIVQVTTVENGKVSKKVIY
ncbi:MAG: T9SS sorting signal type C domain-containing protein [Flavobacterium sp.]|nr:MAG: T9SS sorting signal type C domain-containing protein [Flavobacterium sp.]